MSDSILPPRELPAAIQPISATGRWHWTTIALAWLLILTGAAIRINQFQVNRSLWLDEAMLALNILQRSYADLLKPLEYFQEAPVGFLMAEKLAVEWLGNREMNFRLVPLLASILAFPLFYLIGKRCLSSRATLLGLALLVFSLPLLRYANEAKPYAGDVFWTLLILLLARKVGESPSTPLLIGYALAGIVAVWFSYPALFVLAGAGGALIFWSWLDGHRRLAIILAFIAASWVTSFAVVYWISIRQRIGNEVLTEYWSERFMPFPPTSASDLKWYVRTFFATFRDVVGLELHGVGALAFIIGCVGLVRHDRWLLIMIGLPIIVGLGFAAMKFYPFSGRLILFTVPLLVIGIAHGVDWFMRSTSHMGRSVGWALLVLLLLYPVADTLDAAMHPPESQEMRPLIEHLKANLRDEDVVYVYYNAVPAYKYYSNRYDLEDTPYIRGLESPDDWNGYVDDLQQLRGRPRVWIIISHITRGRADEAELFKFLLSRMGNQLEEVKVHEAVMYLYDLRSGPAEQKLDFDD